MNLSIISSSSAQLQKLSGGWLQFVWGANNLPGSLLQYKSWTSRWLPGGQPIFYTTICWAIWKKRNEACFDNKLLRNPADILMNACAFMSY
jgi:hypothetical protein